ncbi:MAG: hypothetical protein R3200_10420 [Xanthomonadales bacterium]|nr:hypothetical protein [Xanthomonadales bacterium]
MRNAALSAFLIAALNAWTSLSSAQVIEISGTRPLSEELGVPGDRTWIAVNGGLARPLSTFYRLPEGTHKLLIIERTADGQLGESRWVNVSVPPQAAQTMVPFALQFDTTPPQIKQNSQYGARGEKPPVLVLDESGIRSVRYLVGDQPLMDYFAANPGLKGTIQVTVEVEDGAGNRARREVDYEIDAEGPSVEWSTAASPIEGTDFYAAPLEITLEATDPSGVSKLEVLGDNPAEIRSGGTYTATSSSLRVAATDKLGNRVERTLQLPLDDQAPNIDLSRSGSSLTAVATDAGAGIATVEYRIGDGRWRTLEGAIEVGNDTIEVRAIDRAGNEAIESLERTDG